MRSNTLDISSPRCNILSSKIVSDLENLFVESSYNDWIECRRDDTYRFADICSRPT